MSKFFGNLGDDPRMQRQALISRYSAARANLLLMIIFTAVNMLTLATGIGGYFLFSATVPYLITELGMFLCGKLPEEYYVGMEAMIFFKEPFLIVTLILAFLILAIYLLCWIFSKKNKVVFIKIALGMFIFDTAVLLLTGGLSMIIDLIFHIWVIVILVTGISAHKKLKKLPEETGFIEGEFTEITTDDGESIDGATPTRAPDSVALRPADLDVKARIFLEYEAYGHKIIYRRVKRTNELVIDGIVYGEYTALVETPHLLTANVGGHSFAAGTDNTSHMTISVDGQIAKTKLRLV